jgi:chromosomal replication initiator protein
MEKSEVWKDTLEIIKLSVSPAIFKTWFSQTHISTLDDLKDRVVVEIGCSTAFAKNTIESRYFGLVQDSLNKVAGKKCDLLFAVKDNPNKVAPESKEISPLFFDESKDTDFIERLKRARIRPHFNFENFAVSGSNQMAHAAAEAVSTNPGSAYNPLFIWGGVGVGKTHLMQAVGYELLKKNSSLNMVSCTAEDFTNDIVEGIRSKTTPEVRKKYRKLDVLLIDDIQFIAGKETAQEEFFHTFNAVTSAGGQIILTSDRPPSEISKLEDRLKSRFEAGLIVDIAPPDFELRCAITQIKAKEKEIPLDMEQVQIIAGNLDSARQIEGILIKLMTQINFKKVPITNELVETTVGKGVEANGRVVRKNPGEIIEAVSRYYSIGKRALLGESRARPVARPRQILMHILRTDLQIPLEEIGRIVGGRDHTTVMHAVEKITQLASTNVQIREDMSKIRMGI